MGIDFTGNAKKAVDILGNNWEYECMGCSIAKGEIIPPGGHIYNGKCTILAADPEVPIPGFLIVNTKKHVRSFSEFNKEERDEISDVIAFAEKALRELNITDEITLVQEERSKHFHIWIFPHYEWMDKQFGKGVSYLRDIMSYAQEKSTEKTVEEVLITIDKLKRYFEEHDFDN